MSDYTELLKTLSFSGDGACHEAADAIRALSSRLEETAKARDSAHELYVETLKRAHTAEEGWKKCDDAWDAEVKEIESTLETAEKKVEQYEIANDGFQKALIEKGLRLGGYREFIIEARNCLVDQDIDGAFAVLATALKNEGAVTETPPPFEAVVSCSVDGCDTRLRITSEQPFELGETPWKCTRHDRPKFSTRVVERHRCKVCGEMVTLPHSCVTHGQPPPGGILFAESE